MGRLEDLRQKIDRIDIGILVLLAERAGVVEEIRKYKEKNGLNVVDEKREQEIYEKIRKQAKKFGVDGNYVVKVFKLIIEEARKEQYAGASQNGRN